MGVFPESVLLVQLGVEETKERNSNGSVWKQTLMESKADKSRRRRRSSSKKRRSSAKGIERRVSTLRTLVPNTNSEAVGLEQLFTQTADYILSLQTRVRLMQTMVDVLSAGSSDE